MVDGATGDGKNAAVVYFLKVSLWPFAIMALRTRLAKPNSRFSNITSAPRIIPPDYTSTSMVDGATGDGKNAAVVYTSTANHYPNSGLTLKSKLR